MGNSTSSFSEAQHTFPDAELLHVGGTTCECYRVKLYGKLHFLKRLKPELRTNPQYVAALQKEFELGYQLEHPHIVRYVSKTADGILMDYVDGETLDKFIEHHPDFFKKKENADRIVLQLLDAVGYLHQQQIIHLDLKPSNIIITRIDRDVKLIDLGFSYSDSYTDTTGYTAKYAAPERLEGTVIPDVRTDIYAIGKILQQLPCAKRYAKVIRRCMDVDPALRYSSVSEVELQIKGRRFHLFPWLLAFLVLAVSLFAFFLFQEKRSEDMSGQEVPQTEMRTESQTGVQTEEDDMVTETEEKQQIIMEKPVSNPEATQDNHQPSPTVGTTQKKPNNAALDISSLRKEFYSLCIPVYKEELAAYRDSSYQSVGFIRFNAVSCRFRDKMNNISYELWETRYKNSSSIYERDFHVECSDIILQFINNVYDDMLHNDQKQ